MRNIIIHQFNPYSDWVTIQVIDMFQDAHYMEVKTVDLAAYQDGELVQSAFPYLTPGQRELIVTGITDEIWDEMFGDEEE